MTSLSIVWHTRLDDRVCPICQALEGYVWTFEAGKDQLNGQLVHPQYGVVWDVARGSQAHGHSGSCRCNFTYSFDLSDLIKPARDLLEAVKQAYTPSEASP